MPRDIETLINEYDDQHHPLAAGIELRELKPLARALSARLAPPTLPPTLRSGGLRRSGDLRPRRRLDFSVESLNALQPAAVRYARQAPLALLPQTKRAGQAAPRRQPFSDEEHLRIVRELAAYLGCVFLRAVDGTWHNPGRLWLVAVVKQGSILIVENGQASHWSRWGVWVGQAAAQTWQAALAGKTNGVDLRTFRG